MVSTCVCQMVYRTLRMPLAAALLFVVGVGALLTALIAEHYFGIAPCVLCLWDRVPYGFVAAFAAVSLWAEAKHKNISHICLVLILVAFVAGIGLSIFHTGVERHWWLGTSGCTIQPLSGDSVQSLREQLLATGKRNCDEINWELFGLTLVNYNLIASFFLAIYAALVVFLYGKPDMDFSTCHCRKACRR